MLGKHGQLCHFKLSWNSNRITPDTRVQKPTLAGRRPLGSDVIDEEASGRALGYWSKEAFRLSLFLSGHEKAIRPAMHFPSWVFGIPPETQSKTAHPILG